MLFLGVKLIMKLINLLLIICFIGNTSYAEEVIFLEKDQKAPHAGLLFTESKAKEVRSGLLERDALKGINESLARSNQYLQQNSEIKDKQIKILFEQNDVLVQRAFEIQKTNFWRDAAIVVLTIASVYGSIKLGQQVVKW